MILTLAGENTIIKIKCVTCKTEHSITVKTVDWLDFQNERKLIQQCFPYLSVDIRELLMSGMCGKCFDDLYKNEE